MIRLAHAAVLLFATFVVAAAACAPEREILSSLEKDSGAPPDPGAPKPDSGKPTPDDSPSKPTPCKTHEMCPIGELCVDRGGSEGPACKPCSETDPALSCKYCPADWIKVFDKRNGCEVCSCAPKSACLNDGQCADGERCYLGQICDPGCTNSPKCCYGNICAPSGCTDTTGLDCTLVGCPSGQTCNSDCAPPTCTCDAKLKTWKCEGGCKATCIFPK